MAPEKENYALKILPAWSSDLKTGNIVNKDSLIPFRLKNEFGYISSSGNISYMNEIFYNVT